MREEEQKERRYGGGIVEEVKCECRDKGLEVQGGESEAKSAEARK